MVEKLQKKSTLWKGMLVGIVDGYTTGSAINTSNYNPPPP